MKLHNNQAEFYELVSLTAKEKHIPESAVERDYFIVRALSYLSRSEYAEKCVFKGGTSLSKCYPDSIERFSEDIDLTFVPDDSMSNTQIEHCLKRIEKIMTEGSKTEIIPTERNYRNKSLYYWFNDRNRKIKLEIGSSVKPEPFSKRELRSYIQEYLELHGLEDIVSQYNLLPVMINVLNVERTFVDKLMSVKRHSICGTISEKSRHIYDVTRLFQIPEIKLFLQNKEELKRLMLLTKQTDAFYLQKRNIPVEYVPTGAYNFLAWQVKFEEARKIYEHLHEDLLYTDEKQNFNEAVEIFRAINEILAEIGE